MIIELKFAPLSSKQLVEEVLHFGVPGVHRLLNFGNALGFVEGAALKIARLYLEDNYPEAELHAIHFEQSEDGMFCGVEMAVTVYEYSSLMAKLMPLLKKVIEQEEGVQPILDVFEIIEKDSPDSFKDIIIALGNQKTEDVLLTLINGYEALICERVNQRLEQNGVAVRITKIKLEK